MKTLTLIKVEYMGRRRRQDEQIRLCSKIFKECIFLPLDNNYKNVKEMAAKYLEDRGFKIIGKCIEGLIAGASDFKEKKLDLIELIEFRCWKTAFSKFANASENKDKSSTELVKEWNSLDKEKNGAKIGFYKEDFERLDLNQQDFYRLLEELKDEGFIKRIKITDEDDGEYWKGEFFPYSEYPDQSPGIYVITVDKNFDKLHKAEVKARNKALYN